MDAARALPRGLPLAGGSFGQLALFAGLLVLLGVFVAYPLVRVLAVAVAGPDGPTLAHLAGFLQRALFLEATRNTFLAGAAAVVLGSVIALPLALLVARCDFPGRGLVQTLSVLPLVIPPFVGAVAFQQVLAGWARRRCASAWRRRCAWWASRGWRRGAPASSPAASSSAWRWPARSCCSRAPCSSTSRCPISTPACERRCAWSCAGSTASSASRRSTSPTTRTRRWRCPRASPCSIAAPSCSSARRSTSTGGTNVLPGTLEAGGEAVRLRAGPRLLVGRSEAPAGARVLCLVRQEPIRLTAGAADGPNHFAGRIMSAVFLGGRYDCEVALADGIPLRVEVPAGVAGVAPTPDETTVIVLEPEDVIVLAD